MPPYIDRFNDADKDQMAEHERQKPAEEGRRQADESKSSGYYRQEGQRTYRCDADESERRQGRGGAALDEGQLFGAQGVQDKGLSPHGFNKPARLEGRNKKSLGSGIAGGNQLRPAAARKGRGDDEEHECECEHVKDGAHRPYPEHEACDGARLP